MLDSSIVRSLKVRNHTITYSFGSLRSFIFKAFDLSISIGVSSLIMDMAKNISERSYNQWVPFCLIWIIFKFYYLCVASQHIFEISAINGGVGTQ